MEEEPLYSFSVSLRIKSPIGKFNEEFASTGLTPTYSHKKGDIRKSTTEGDILWENDMWFLDSPLSGENDLSTHLMWIWDKIKPHQSFFKRLISSGVDIDIYCTFKTDTDTGGFDVSPDALRLFTELGVKMEVSVFFV